MVWDTSTALDAHAWCQFSLCALARARLSQNGNRATGGWTLARTDVQQGHPWSVVPQRPSDDTIVLHLLDTRQTTPQQVGLIDITAGPDGGLRAHHTTLTAPKVGLRGDEDTDTHLAIMLALLRENGGTLSVHAHHLLAIAELIQGGHDWRVRQLPFSGTVKTFHLDEPAT